MAIERIACPSCGAPLDVLDDATTATCRFCGSTLRLNFGPPPDTGIEPNGTIRDKATGKGLFMGKWPAGWRVTYTTLDVHNDTSRPYVPRAVLSRGNASIVLLQGAAGERMSAVLKGMVAMYGSHLVGVDRTNYAEMPDPLALADDAARGVVGASRGEAMRLVQQLVLPGLGDRQQQALTYYQRVVEAPVSDPFMAEVFRVYEFSVQGAPWKAAAYVQLSAVKQNISAGLTGGLGEGLGGNLFAGLFGKMRGAGDADAGAGAGAGAACAGWCTHDQAAYAKGGNLVWGVDLIATLACPASDYDKLLPAFLPMLGTVQAHGDVVNLMLEARREQSIAIQQATQGAQARQQAAFEAQQASIRQMQAAFDAKNASWQAAQDAHHQAFRERTNAPFSGAGGGGGAPDFSEAIRGVNTYVTSDGREVQVSVQADHAWENQAGDVIGTAGSLEPGHDWTELPRR